LVFLPYFAANSFYSQNLPVFLTLFTNCLRKCVLNLVILAFSLPGFTQINSLSVQNLSSVNVDELSDTEIKTYWLKAAENGLSEDNIYRILQEKGMPQAEISKLSKRIEKILSDKPDTQETDSKIADQKNKKTERFTEKDASVPMQKSKTDLSIYGSQSCF
jgi:hypothetical protein